MRIIDADSLDKRIYNDIPISVFGSIKKMAAVREIIAEQPTIDAVPVKWIENYMDSLGANGLLFNAMIIEKLLRDYKKRADGERRTDDEDQHIYD